MKKLLSILSISALTALIATTTDCRLGHPSITKPLTTAATARAKEASPASISTHKAVFAQEKQNEQEQKKAISAIKQAKKMLETAQNDEERSVALMALEQAIKKGKDVMDQTQNLFSNSPTAMQDIARAQKRKEFLVTQLNAEKAKYERLSDTTKQAASLKRQKNLERAIYLEQVALGEKWSGTKKALVTIGTGAIVLGGAYYMGVLQPVVSAGASYVTPWFTSTKDTLANWWAGSAKKGAESVGELGFMSQMGLGASQTPGFGPRVPAALVAEGLGASAATWPGYGAIFGTTFVLNKIISWAEFKTLGFVWDNTKHLFFTPDGKEVLKPDGTPLKPSDLSETEETEEELE